MCIIHTHLRLGTTGWFFILTKSIECWRTVCWGRYSTVLYHLYEAAPVISCSPAFSLPKRRLGNWIHSFPTCASVTGCSQSIFCIFSSEVFKLLWLGLHSSFHWGKGLFSPFLGPVSSNDFHPFESWCVFPSIIHQFTEFWNDGFRSQIHQNDWFLDINLALFHTSTLSTRCSPC